MKSVKILLIVLLGSSSLAFAQRAGLTLGVSQVQVEGASGVDVSSQGSFQMGALFYHPISEMVDARIGALLSQETLVASSGTVDTTLNIANLNVPLTLGYKPSERFLLFAGPVLMLNTSKACSASGTEVGSSSCSLSDLKIKGSDILLSVGVNFQLTSEFGMELSYDKMGGKPFAGSTGGQIINVNFQYNIE